MPFHDIFAARPKTYVSQLRPLAQARHQLQTQEVTQATSRYELASKRPSTVRDRARKACSRFTRIGLLVQLAGLALACSTHSQVPLQATGSGIRVLSWNVSGNPVERQPIEFAALLRSADPDVLILDECSPDLDLDRLHSLLPRAESGPEWNITMGRSGGRQRTVIASRAPHRAIALLAEEVAYPESDRLEIEQRMSLEGVDNPEWRLDMGIPVHGAVIDTAEGGLLVVGMDLQCCGNELSSWEEARRRLEAKEIRRRIRLALDDPAIDGLVVTGDLNIVGTVMPLITLTGPYGERHRSLSPAEIYHLDGTTAWTWDGRGTRFASRPMDFQLYGSQALVMQSGFVIDSQDMDEAELESLGLDHDGAHRVSDHRPLLVEYIWADR